LAATVDASATVIGDVTQNRLNDAFGLSTPEEHANELTNTLVDAASAGLGGGMATKLADKLIPIPNVTKQIELLQFASRRSTRAAQQAAAQLNGQIRAFWNSFVSGAAQTYAQSALQLFCNTTTPSAPVPTPTLPPTQQCTSTSLNGKDLGTVCRGLQ
jgi:hypothetical protein